MFTYYVTTFELKNPVPLRHKKLWRPMAANRGSCDLKDILSYGHNKLWRPPVAKFRLWVQENDYVICEQPLKVTEDYAIQNYLKFSNFFQQYNQRKGVVHILPNHFHDVTDGNLRPEVATVSCGRRPQHSWSHRTPYSRPEAATVPCPRRAQEYLSHRWLRYTWMFSKQKLNLKVLN